MALTSVLRRHSNKTIGIETASLLIQDFQNALAEKSQMMVIS
jgi:hypothetical protein